MIGKLPHQLEDNSTVVAANQPASTQQNDALDCASSHREKFSLECCEPKVGDDYCGKRAQAASWNLNTVCQ